MSSTKSTRGLLGDGLKLANDFISDGTLTLTGDSQETRSSARDGIHKRPSRRMATHFKVDKRGHAGDGIIACGGVVLL